MIDPNQLTETLARLTSEVTGVPARELSVQKLKGDASSRSYYRVARPGGPSAVAMVLPADATKSEEASKGDAPAELPFLNVHRYLAAQGVPVPRIERIDLGAGVLILEDLGDVTLEAALLAGGEAARDRWYGEAIDLLVALRAKAEAQPGGCIAFERAFDFDLLRWEFDHYVEWGLRARTGRRLDEHQEALLRDAGDRLCRAIADLPRGFTHRDYQSRNLMVTPRGLVVIDFQDALLGPRVYDLVALLRDSYVELPEPFVDAMLRRYLEGLRSRTGESVPFEAFRRTFDLVTVQRKLKDGGRFEFIDRVKKNPSFLPHVPASFRYVARALERLPEERPLLALLRDIHPEM
ncbi:MAG TPA: phosphotransferase, partial [Myxococcales bacterium]|nr:phosphotransferase [Myxococcales bacterium]